MSNARGFLGAGDLYIARFIGGTLAGVTGPFECTKFEIKPNSELKELTSRGRNSYGQVIEAVPVPQPADLTVDLTEVNPQSLAIALFGTVAAIVQSAGALVDEVLATKHNEWAPLTKARLTGPVTVTNTGGTTTYAEGTDYILNRELGWVKTLPGGAIPATANVEVSGNYDSISGTEIRGITDSQVRAKFILDGKNFVDNAPCITTVYEAIITADSAFDFLADDFNTISLPGRMKTPAGFNEPFTVALRNTPAA